MYKVKYLKEVNGFDRWLYLNSLENGEDVVFKTKKQAIEQLKNFNYYWILEKTNEKENLFIGGKKDEN